jgi:hypothetical protein
VVYLLMIHSDESIWTKFSEAEHAATMARHDALQRELEKADQWRGCGGLAPTTEATTLRWKKGKAMVTDGPYAEAKEAFGGYYIVEVDDLDQAIAIAEKIPNLAEGAVEIRPIAAFLR